MKTSTSVQASTRKVVHRTRGYRHGPIARLMSPSDLGEQLKPFVFLDLFEADMRALAGSMPVHPHSGIATVTVVTDGDMTFDDPVAGHGTIGYGGLEWARAGLGMWHGKELSAGSSPLVQGFQLWIALPPELERAEPEGQYLDAQQVPRIGPARLVVGAYETATSPVRAPRGINYLLVTLKPGERWSYEPPAGHTVGWVAVAKGALSGSERLSNGELGIFEAARRRSRLRERKTLAQRSFSALRCRIRTSCTWAPTRSTRAQTLLRRARATSANSRNVWMREAIGVRHRAQRPCFGDDRHSVGGSVACAH